jgi:hypothetical protein
MKNGAAILVICVIVILVTVVWGAKTQPEAVLPSAKWEYKIVSHASLAGIKSMEDIWAKAFGENGALSFEGAEKLNAEIAAKMNLLGKEGWELVCNSKETGFVFKRKKY